MDGSAGESEPAFTAEELLQQMEEANRVLGFDDPDKCTYEMGYRPRQAVFSCLTCTPSEPAGVCTACSMTCHESHELVELWTKREFRCDCGNSKFADVECKLLPAKDLVNEKNKYNQNFKGMYCSCHRPYPDHARQEAGEEEVMTQCVVCEDWFHEEHFDIPDDGFEEFICTGCFQSKCKFLALYSEALLDPEAEESNPAQDGILGREEDSAGDSKVKRPESESGDAIGRQSPMASPGLAGSAPQLTSMAAGMPPKVQPGGAESAVECMLSSVLEGRTLTDAVEALTDKDLLSFSKALRETFTDAAASQDAPHDAAVGPAAISNGETATSASGILSGSETHSGSSEKGPSTTQQPDSAGDSGSADASGAGASSNGGPDAAAAGSVPDAEGLTKEETLVEFFPLCLRRGWRMKLCTCQRCCSYYEVHGVPFLVDEKDTIRAYEEVSKAKEQEAAAQAEDELNRSWDNLGRVGQLEVLYGMEDFKTSLAAYMEKFKGTDHVMTASDVQDFFEEFRKKRPRRV